MSHGEFRDNQAETVKPFIEGKVIHDLGCGDLTLAHQLLRLGAEKVIAIDRYSPLTYSKRTKLTGIDLVTCYFHDFKGTDIDTVFVSWPINWYDYGLGQLIEKAKTIIYLGSNFDGSACGYSDMWDYLSTRRILAHVPNSKNTLIVYDREYESRKKIPEERAALSPLKIQHFKEAYGVSSGDDQTHQRTG